MEIGITKQLIDRLKIINLEEIKETDPNFIWEATYRDVCGKKLLVGVHAYSRYCGIFTGITSKMFSDLNKLFYDCIYVMMKKEGFSENDIKTYFAMADKISITKTHGSKVSGGLKHILTELNYYDKYLIPGNYQVLISNQANEGIGTNPYHGKEYFEPTKEFIRSIKELVEDYSKLN